MTYKDLRTEFDNPAFRNKVKDLLPKECVNCGSDKNIEYHHIVPLKLGGTNNIRNIVPLCHKCHKASHYGQHILHYTDSGNSGRKSISSIENDSKIFDMFINGEIGNRKCLELLGYSKRSAIKDRPEFKRYLKSKGILRVKNIVDVAATNRRAGLVDGDPVGEIEYLDGRIEKIMFKDTGVNDIDYKCRA